MQNQPLLTITIPSRNRQKYAISCIRSILSFKDDRLELIVHDNSDTNQLQVLIESEINDSRLKYIYDSSPMSTVDNFNKSMNFVTGEYICFIGDDDGVTHEIIEIADWAKKNKIDAVVEQTRISYSWPNTFKKGTMFIYPFTGRIIDVNISKTLNRFLNDGGVYYLQYDLPRVYHGIIRKDCFDRVKQEIGYYFGGLSVDIFASVAVSLTSLKVVSIDYPLTIAGSSAEADQTHRTEKAKKMELKDAPHFREIYDYIWSKEVPPVYSVATIWSESGIQALKAFKREDLVSSVNRFRLGAYISLENIDHEKFIKEELLLAHKNRFTLCRYHLIKMVIRFEMLTGKIFNRLVKFVEMKKMIKFEDIDSIEDVVKKIQIYFKKAEINIGQFLN